jgi:hypothetical protein
VSEATAAAAEARARRAAAQQDSAPSPLDALFARSVRWFTTGNVPV